MIAIETYKGIPPGKIISHTLKKKAMTQRQLAKSLSVKFQTISAIVTGKRGIPDEFCFKLDKALGFENGFFLLIQTYYKIQEHNKSITQTKHIHPDIRSIVFWDIDYNTLDWGIHKDFIIKRVQERGNAEEIEKVLKYYEAEA
jgi:addiction module HigA family antidote